MRRSRLRSYIDAGAVLACEIALVVFFWESRPVLGAVDFTHFGQWLETTSSTRALSALVRLLGLAISGWLVLSTLLYAVAALSGHKWLLRRSRRVTIPLVRRVVDAVAVASLRCRPSARRLAGHSLHLPQGQWRSCDLPGQRRLSVGRGHPLSRHGGRRAWPGLRPSSSARRKRSPANNDARSLANRWAVQTRISSAPRWRGSAPRLLAGISRTQVNSIMCRRRRRP